MVLPGNHDVSCAVTGSRGCPPLQNNFSALRYRFRMPSAESGASTGGGAGPHQNLWYSWRVGAVHFVAVNTESDYPSAPSRPSSLLPEPFVIKAGGFGDQLGWLARDLQR